MGLICMSGAGAQTLTDGLMMPQRNLCTGFLYANDQWKNYWEGTRMRDNLNLGKVTTQSIMWMGAYGITKHGIKIGDYTVRFAKEDRAN